MNQGNSEGGQVIRRLETLTAKSFNGKMSPERMEDLIGVVESSLKSAGINCLGEISSNRIKYRNIRRLRRLRCAIAAFEQTQPEIAGKVFRFLSVALNRGSE
jgi:hypothetical protein